MKNKVLNGESSLYEWQWFFNISSQYLFEKKIYEVDLDLMKELYSFLELVVDKNPKLLHDSLKEINLFTELENIYYDCGDFIVKFEDKFGDKFGDSGMTKKYSNLRKALKSMSESIRDLIIGLAIILIPIVSDYFINDVKSIDLFQNHLEQQLSNSAINTKSIEN